VPYKKQAMKAMCKCLTIINLDREMKLAKRRQMNPQEIIHLGQEQPVTLEDEGSVFLPNVRNQ